MMWDLNVSQPQQIEWHDAVHCVSWYIHVTPRVVMGNLNILSHLNNKDRHEKKNSSNFPLFH